jgi:hypothetical protein
VQEGGSDPPPSSSNALNGIGPDLGQFYHDRVETLLERCHMQNDGGS